MKKLAWVFGKSSDFASNIIKELEEQDISVHGFGRDNVDYANFDKFIDGKVVPDIVVINANIEEQIALVIDNKMEFGMEDVLKIIKDAYMNAEPDCFGVKHLCIYYTGISNVNGD